MPSLSYHSRRALAHLKALAPTDGWSVEDLLNEVRLLRRNVPLTDNYFLDLYVEPTAGRTVGILSTATGQGQVLVDASGKPTGRYLQIISCPSYHEEQNHERGGTMEGPGLASTTTTPLSDEDNKALILYAAYAVGAAIAVRLVLQAAFIFYLLALPILYSYAHQTCPPDESFDAKQQLKRVLRGHHLPDDHPDKPKGFLQSTMAKWSATITTELSTSLGYEVDMTHVLGVLTLARVTVPAVNRTFVWMGVTHNWRYVYCQELEPTANAAR